MVADENKNGKGNQEIESSSWADGLIEKLVPKSHSEPFLISIIIPLLNSSEKIAVTLDSIKNHSYKNVGSSLLMRVLQKKPLRSSELITLSSPALFP